MSDRGINRILLDWMAGMSKPARGESPRAARQPERLAMGELEAAVMEVLWDRGGWLTPGEVHEVLAARRPLAYTTVMTILVRLWQKGRLERERDGRAFAYRPLDTREEHAARRMRELLTDVTDRPAVLSHFLNGLPAADRAQLRRLLRSLDLR
jgi:predicted transcriptional regulator